MRRILILISVLCIVFSLLGCQKSVEDKSFSSNGLEITLTNEFKESNKRYLTLYTDDIKVVITASPSSSIGNLSLEEYAALLSESIGFLTRVDDDGLGGAFVYEYSLEGENFAPSKCLLAIYKTEDYYYNVTFSCLEENYESNKSQFLTWLQSITLLY